LAVNRFLDGAEKVIDDAGLVIPPAVSLNELKTFVG
jgi:hypothetical protein